MTKKYFNYQGAPWQIIQSQDPWGNPLTYAIEMNSTDGAMLNTGEYASDWEYVEAKEVRIDEWFLKSDPNDLFEPEDNEQYEDDLAQTVNSSKLKAMLEGLKNRSDDEPIRRWSLQDDDDMNRHERLKASLDQSSRTVGEAAEDILGMIRARQANEISPTVILNPKKYPDSKTLETTLEGIRKKDVEAEVWVGNIPADDFLATLRNKETVGLSSIPDLTKPLGLTLDQETLELIKKLTPKK